MGRFTYEDVKPENQKLETYEWDNIWWEHAPDTEKKRVLIVGDSMTCGYRDVVNKVFDGEMFADGYGSSKAVDNPFLIPALDLMIAQSNCSMILFNNGLHGFHLSVEEYKKYYLKIIDHFREAYPDKKIVIILTTPTREKDNLENIDKERTQNAIDRNKAAKEIAEKYGLGVIDLFSVLIDADYRLWRDIVHLTAAGNDILGKFVADYIKKNI